ncbi:MAG: SDR family oxidoreductase [Chloroflexota bacterium]
MLDGPAPRILVTGAASGIGRAAAVRLARHGAHVLATDVNDADGATLAEEAGSGTLVYRHADVTDEAQVTDAVADAVARWGGLDALVAVAGVMRGQMQDLRTFELATWDLVVDTNLKGAFLAAKHAAGPMLAAGRGTIVLVGSRAGVSAGSGSYAYGASKGGTHGLAMTLERHLGPLGVRVHDLCPGDVDTPLFRRSIAEAVANGADPAWAAGVLAKLTPPDAIADVIAFLVSDAARAVRGTVFTA